MLYLGAVRHMTVLFACSQLPCWHRWCSGRQCVVECLSQLKRTNWSWDWGVDASESFTLPAQAFLGSFGRAGRGAGVVGVMQATGRPFGELNLALLACQRLACVVEKDRDAMRNVRDQGVLLCHLQKHQDAVAAFERYQAWVAAHPEAVASDAVPDGDLIQPEELELVHGLQVKLAQLTLEACYTSS
jgi:hypothetical protein